VFAHLIIALQTEALVLLLAYIVCCMNELFHVLSVFVNFIHFFLSDIILS